MVASLHCVITEIEDERLRMRMKSWRVNFSNDISYQRLLKYKKKLDTIVSDVLVPHLKDKDGESLQDDISEQITYELHDLKKYNKEIGCVCNCCFDYFHPKPVKDFMMSCPSCGLNPYCKECWYEEVLAPMYMSNCTVQCPFCTDGHLSDSINKQADKYDTELSAYRKWLHTINNQMFVAAVDFIRHGQYDELNEKEYFIRDYFINLKKKYPDINLNGMDPVDEGGSMAAVGIGGGLEALGLTELKDLAAQQGVNPEGDKRKRQTWIEAFSINNFS